MREFEMREILKFWTPFLEQNLAPPLYMYIHPWPHVHVV